MKNKLFYYGSAFLISLSIWSVIKSTQQRAENTSLNTVTETIQDYESFTDPDQRLAEMKTLEEGQLLFESRKEQPRFTEEEAQLICLQETEVAQNLYLSLFEDQTFQLCYWLEEEMKSYASGVYQFVITNDTNQLACHLESYPIEKAEWRYRDKTFNFAGASKDIAFTRVLKDLIPDSLNHEYRVVEHWTLDNQVDYWLERSTNVRFYKSAFFEHSLEALLKKNDSILDQQKN